MYVGRMDEPVTARGAAEQAAEATRTLNHLTLAPPAERTPGWEDLADVYAIVGQLRLLVERLPQALDQLARALEDAAVVYGTDDGTDPTEVALTASIELFAGRGPATELNRSLQQAHNALSHLYVERHLVVGDEVAE